ncbi:MAG TPA: hypothetical protein VLA72_00965 [Anaerolineales bacterium]|jgi:hypothetical protein|nr:hypothetical protein [Anaerolineales bacterium]
MGNKLTPKVILEGTRLTFKTEIAFEINEHPRIVGPRKYRYHSPLISAEWCTFKNYPWDISRRPNDYVTWTKENRYIPELTCEQWELYQVEPLCPEEGNS